jgi:hypothetical protein
MTLSYCGREVTVLTYVAWCGRKVAQLRPMAASLHISAYCTLIENKQPHATEGSQEAGIAAVAASKREIGEVGMR